MVRLLLSSLLAFAASHEHKAYLADLILPPELVPRAPAFEADRFDVFRDIFDTILRRNGFDEEHLKSLPAKDISHYNVTMRDGVGINTLVVKDPLEFRRRPAIVSRSPYGTLGTNALALIFTLLNGYTAVIQDQRGTQESGGVFDMWTQEGNDSTDIADWISTQRWSNGEVFYTGASADGAPGNFAVIGDPSRMKGEWLIFTAENGHDFAYPQGSYRQDLVQGYLTYINAYTHDVSKNVMIPKIQEKEAYDDWWASITLARNESSSSVQPFLYGKINWPIVDSVGWWDLFQHTHLNHWRNIRGFSDETVRDQHVLFVGPMGHCLFSDASLHQVALAEGETEGLIKAGEMASAVFKGDFDGEERSKVGRVNLFVMGTFHETYTGSSGNYWTSLDEFPSPEPTHFFLGATGSLDTTSPTESGMRQYVYDPASATPMLGGNNLPMPDETMVCGTADQISKVNRTDLLIYDSAPLAAEMAIAGEISARLFVGSSARDTDFFVTVEDLAADKNQSMLVRYGMARMRWRCSDEVVCPVLEEDGVYAIEVSLWASAYVFPEGHSVRVTVSSAAYPYFNANPNTGNPLFTPGDDEPVKATNTVHISPAYPSSLLLPVVSLADLPQNHNFSIVSARVVV